MNPQRLGCKLSYQGNVLCCSRFRTSEENFEATKRALIELLGADPFEDQHGQIPFQVYNGKVEFYRST